MNWQGPLLTLLASIPPRTENLDAAACENAATESKSIFKIQNFMLRNSGPIMLILHKEKSK